MKTRVLVDSDVFAALPADAYVARNGYGVFRDPATKKSVYVHRWIAERALGRPLPVGAVVHHVNYDRLDNRRGNLVVCPDDVYHQLLHRRTDVLNAGGDPNTQKICCGCKTVLNFSEFSPNKHHAGGLNGTCRPCSNVRRRGKYKKSPEQVAKTNASRRADPVRWARHLEWTRNARKKAKTL